MSFQYVRIYYGPYEAFFTNSHKPQKLRGLRDQLRILGFRVDLVPVDFLNYCMFEICGFEVFRCNISNLSFNTPAEQDVVCRRAVAAIVAASTRLARARCYLWLWKLLEERMFKGVEFAPKFTPLDFDLRAIKPLECFLCCTSNEPCKDDVEAALQYLQKWAS